VHVMTIIAFINSIRSVVPLVEGLIKRIVAIRHHPTRNEIYAWKYVLQTQVEGRLYDIFE